MALVQNPIIGKASGSVGNVTFAGWKGKNVMKTKAENSYSNPTQGQLNNNEMFATLVAFYRSIAVIITSGFKALAVGKSEYNAFMQENPYSETVTGTPGNYKVATNLIKISKGPELTSFLDGVTKAANGANGIIVSWSNTSGLDPNTPIVIAAFNRTTGEFLVSGNEVFDNEQKLISSTGMGTAIATTDVYIYYCNLTTGKACDSILVTTA